MLAEVPQGRIIKVSWPFYFFSHVASDNQITLITIIPVHHILRDKINMVEGNKLHFWFREQTDPTNTESHVDPFGLSLHKLPQKGGQKTSNLWHVVSSFTFELFLLFSSGIRTEQDLYVRLIDSMTKQVRGLH